jgi:hypothetical protein
MSSSSSTRCPGQTLSGGPCRGKTGSHTHCPAHRRQVVVEEEPTVPLPPVSCPGQTLFGAPCRGKTGAHTHCPAHRRQVVEEGVPVQDEPMGRGKAKGRNPIPTPEEVLAMTPSTRRVCASVKKGSSGPCKRSCAKEGGFCSSHRQGSLHADWRSVQANNPARGYAAKNEEIARLKEQVRAILAAPRA